MSAIEGLINFAGKTAQEALNETKRQMMYEWRDNQRYKQMEERLIQSLVPIVTEKVLANIQIQIKNEASPVIQELNKELSKLGNIS